MECSVISGPPLCGSGERAPWVGAVFMKGFSIPGQPALAYPYIEMTASYRQAGL